MSTQINYTPTALDAALTYAARGWYVFPCGDDKRPLTAHGFKDATTDADQVKAWWRRWPRAAIGLDCGRSGVLAVDLDRDDDRDGLAIWATLGIDDAGALQSQTPRGGRHLVFSANGAALGNSAGRLGPGIDTRGNGGYIILPPSQTARGQYIALNDWTATPAPVPGALVALLSKAEQQRTTSQTTTTGDRWALAALKAEVDNVCAAHEGTRNDTLNRAAYSLGQLVAAGYLTRAEVEAELFAAAEACGLVDDDGDRAAWSTIRSGLDDGATNPRYKPTSPPAVAAQAPTATATATATATGADNAPAVDLIHAPVDHEGHAQVVLKMHPGRIAYNAAFGWLWYTGTHWDRDQAEAYITRAIVDTLKARAIAGIQAEQDMDRFGKKCTCDAGRIAGILTMLEALTYTPAQFFDAAPHLLNCHNGALDLRNLTLIPHTPDQRFTYCLGVDYDSQADTSEAYRDLVALIDDWTPDAAYLQIAGGYSLTGETSEEVLFYMQGPARAGKGSFTEALLTLLPYPLATESGFETFANDRGGDSQNFDLAPLRPCRAVFASESERKHQLNAARVKRLTGGNWITCAYKYRDQFTYRPAFKIWLSSNFPPSLDPDDDAAWGRVKVLKFPNSHLGSEDLSIKKRLKSREYQTALLYWLADGAAIWYTTGLPRPTDAGDGARIATQTQAERDAQDYVLQFTEERLTRTGDEADRLTTGELHTAYESWCKANGVPTKYINQFTQALKAKGWDYRKSGARCFVGVKLR